MLVELIFALMFAKALLLYRGMHVLPIPELKRQARARDQAALKVYKMGSNYKAYDALLIFLGLCGAAGLIYMFSKKSWWASVIVTVLIYWLAFGQKKPKVNGWAWKYVEFSAPYIQKYTTSLVPFLNRVARILPDHLSITHSGLYEKDDLLNLIDAQLNQKDNRIPEADLHVATNALTFGDKKVGDVMASRRKSRFVKEDENIGPMLMDELHATGFNTFAVIKSDSKPASPEFVGLLYLDDLVANANKSTVKDLVRKGKAYINEDLNLRDALDEFIKNKTHLMIVTNNFEEIVGTITFDSVMEQIIGKKIPAEDHSN